MTATKTRKIQDAGTREVFRRLQASFPDVGGPIENSVYRFNSVSIRVRVVSSQFNGLDRKKRFSLFDKYLASLDKGIFEDITILMLLTPEEASDPDNRFDTLFTEFDSPQHSRL